jgi:MFS family permease
LRRHVPHRWLTFSALSLIYFVISAGAFSSLGVVFPAMVGEMHWSWRQAGFGFTLLGVACGLGSLTPAMLIRRVGVRGTMIVGMLTMVAGFSMLALTHALMSYLIGATLVGVAFSLVSTVPGAHVITDIFTNRSTMLGAYFAIGGLGGVAGPMLYIILQGATHGWRPYWWAFVVLSVASGLFAAFAAPLRPDRNSDHPTEPPEQVGPVELVAGLEDWTVRRALTTPQFYIIFGGYTTFLLINTTAHGFAVEHLIERGVSANAAAVMLSLEALIGVGVAIVGGVLGEKVSAKTMMIICMAAVSMGMIALAEAHGWALMLVYAVGVGIGYGLSFVAPTLLLLNYFGKRANLELFSIMCLLSTVAALGPWFGGWARDALGSFEDMFLLCSGVTLVMLLATISMKPPILKVAEGPLPVRSPAE